MRVEDIKIEDVEIGAVYSYIDKDNRKIKEIKVKKKWITKNSGYFLITGNIKIADGTIYPALLGISSNDSGELFESYFFIRNKLISQHGKNFMKLIGKKKEEVFPYKYHLNVGVEGDNHPEHQF